MSRMVDKVVKMIIQANSVEEAESKAKTEQGVKNVLKSEIVTQTFEVTVVQQFYGEYNFGYCLECGTDLMCRAEFSMEMCEEGM